MKRLPILCVVAAACGGGGGGSSGNPPILYLNPTDAETEVVLSGSPPAHEY